MNLNNFLLVSALSLALASCAFISKSEYVKHDSIPISQAKGINLSFHYRWKNGDSPACFTLYEADAIEKAFLKIGLRHDSSSSYNLDVVLTNVTERRYISEPVNVVFVYFTYFIVPLYLAQQFEITVTAESNLEIPKVGKGVFHYEALMSPFIGYKLFTESFKTNLAESKAEALVDVVRKVVSIETLPAAMQSEQSNSTFEQSLVRCSGWQTRTY